MIRRALFCLGLLLSAISAAYAAPAIVQSASSSTSSGTGVVVLGGAPTPGNLIIAWLSASVVGQVDTSKWKLLAANSNYGATSLANGSSIVAVGRYVQGGDTATLPAILTSAVGSLAAEAIEISGVAGTFAADLEAADGKIDSRASTLTTRTLTSAVVNDLALIGFFNYQAGSNITGAAGWSFQVQANNAGNYGAWAITSQAFASASSSIAATVNTPNASNPAGYINIVLSGTGAGSPIMQSSKINSYPELTSNTASAMSASKANAYPDLNAGTANNMSASKIVTYLIIKPAKQNGFVHSFPP